MSLCVACALCVRRVHGVVCAGCVCVCGDDVFFFNEKTVVSITFIKNGSFTHDFQMIL